MGIARPELRSHGLGVFNRLRRRVLEHGVEEFGHERHAWLSNGYFEVRRNCITDVFVLHFDMHLIIIIIN